MRRPHEFPLEVNGETIVFRSNYERSQAAKLVHDGVAFHYEQTQLGYKASVHNGECAVCGSSDVFSSRTYTPDFYFPATSIFVETKGKFDAETRTKMKEIITQSDKDIRMCFMRDNYMTKKKKMKYSRWCELNDIKYAVGNIPEEWIK